MYLFDSFLEKKFILLLLKQHLLFTMNTLKTQKHEVIKNMCLHGFNPVQYLLCNGVMTTQHNTTQQQKKL
jgi:hypothetical protein